MSTAKSFSLIVFLGSVLFSSSILGQALGGPPIDPRADPTPLELLPICQPSLESGQAWMSVFPRVGPHYKDELGNYVAHPPEDVCANRMGRYSDGVRLDNHEGLVQGHYLRTLLLSYPSVYPSSGVPPISALYRPDNDFRVELISDGSEMAPRETSLWLSQTNAYYHITTYIDSYLVGDLQAIGLDAERKFNVIHRGYRPDLVGIDPQFLNRPPSHLVQEDHVAGPFQLLPTLNVQVAPSLIRLGGDRGVEPPMSYSLDSAFTVGEHIGLRAFALTETNKGFPSEFGFGLGWSGEQDISPILNDALNLWIAYDYSDVTDTASNFWFMIRRWAWLTNGNPNLCDTLGAPACLSGNNIDSVLTYRREINNRDGIFPPRQPTSYLTGMGAIDADLAGIFVASLFYEISLFIGKRNTTRLFLKMLSMFGDEHFENLNMVAFANLLLQATDELFGQEGYSEIVRRQLVKKGVPYNPAVTNVDLYFPVAVGDFPASLEKSSANRFGSSFPDSQPTVDNNVVGPGSAIYYSNGYFVDENPQTKGMGLKFWEGSRYGPCDYLAITDGTFDAAQYNGDGTYYHELRDRGLENLVAIVPGNRVRWLRYRGKCADWNDGDYTNDFRPPGFRVTQANLNGYSFKVTRLFETSTHIRYRLEVIDPLIDEVPGLQSVQYLWSFLDMNEASIVPLTDPGEPTVDIQVRRNESIKIRLDRSYVKNTGGNLVEVEHELEIFEKTNSLDRAVDGRPAGQAFVLDLTSP